MGRGGDGERGRWGDAERGRRGEGERGRKNYVTSLSQIRAKFCTPASL
ncbi:MAG: hypothetical protein F6K58_32830, partial [Symploca sp. SIO2E9]|nr:hypothetical protein [Symploca sp. SIO2E9]